MSEAYGVFISHRSEDREIAMVLQGALELFSKFKLDHSKNIYVCEAIPGGTDWRNWIEEKIAKSTILVFLHTEENADWRWCLYEIGLFRGSRSHGQSRKVHMITLKNPHIEKPLPPIDQFQAYDADGAGITEFFKDLCLKGTFTDGEIFNDEFLPMIQKFTDSFTKMVNAFLRPKPETDYVARRIWFDLGKRSGEQGLSVSIDDALLDGDDAILQILHATRGTRYQNLYKKFRKRGQSSWLDDIKNAWNEIAEEKDPPISLTPLVTLDGMHYRPVIAQIDKHRLTIHNKEAIIPKRLVAILVPCMESGADTTPRRPFDSDLFTEKWTTYVPWSIVRIRWHKKSGHRYKPEDMIEEPVVCAMNEAFSGLFDFAFSSSLDTEGPGAWTSRRLLEQIQEYVLPEHMVRLVEDQGKVSNSIIFQDRNDHATIPLQFNDKHPNPIYRKGVYLPCLAAKHIEGDQSREHEIYLLVIYVKDFSPLD